MKPGALRFAGPAPAPVAPKPLPASADEKAARLAQCLSKCGRTPQQLCVLHCCGSQKLDVVAGWRLHVCGKGFWPA